MNDKLTAEFVSELFYCSVQNKSILEICLNYVKENYLPLEEQKLFFEELKHQYKANFKISFGTLVQEFRKNHDMISYISEVKSLNIDEPEAVLDKLEKFIKQSMFIELYNTTHDTYSKPNKGAKEEAYNYFAKGAETMSKFSLKTESLVTVLGDFQVRNSDRVIKSATNIVDKIPFGIDELDVATKGGPEVGELVLWLADSKGGKSIALIHCGINAMRRGFGVLHIQAEGTMLEIADRYDSAWTGTTYYDVKSGDLTEDKFEAHKKIVDNIGKADIHIDCSEKFNAKNMVDIRRTLIELKKKVDIKAVVIDYVDLINPDGGTYALSDERHRQQKTVRAMKDLAVEQKVVIYTATQASSMSKESLDDPSFVISRENLAEDKGKVRPVDMLLTINRTPDERKSKIARIFVEALRGHDSGQIIVIAQALKRMRFYDRNRTIKLDLGEITE